MRLVCVHQNKLPVFQKITLGPVKKQSINGSCGKSNKYTVAITTSYGFRIFNSNGLRTKMLWVSAARNILRSKSYIQKFPEKRKVDVHVTGGCVFPKSAWVQILEGTIGFL